MYNDPLIVIVDDDHSVHSICTDTLSDSYKIKSFLSGEEAVSFILEHGADLLICDIAMPNFTGYDVLSAIVKELGEKALPIIFLSDEADDKVEDPAFYSEVSDYVAKPIIPMVLRSRIKMQLELSAYRNRLENELSAKTKSLQQAYEELKNQQDDTLNLLSQVISIREKGYGGTLLHIAPYLETYLKNFICLQDADYRLSVSGCDYIVKSSKICNVGKLSVPDELLSENESELTDFERKIVESHTILGADLLRKIISELSGPTFLNEAYKATLYHHEKFDGTGYPYGLKGTEIPLCARIIAIIGVYGKEKYKTHEEVLNRIKLGTGKNFDPVLAEILFNAKDEMEAVFKSERKKRAAL